MRKSALAGFGFLVWLALAPQAWAQDPPPPLPAWKVAAGAGLALTNGNSDTSTVNATYDITYDPQTRNMVKSDALYIRGKSESTLTTDRLGINLRDQYKINERTYAFGQNQYLKDRFKNIDYLLAPTGGVGYKLFDSEETKLEVDGGIGGVWEKNPDADVRLSGAVSAAEKFAQTLAGNTALTQSVTALWKTKDFSDSLYTFAVGVAASMSTRIQLKVEFLDTYKNRPPLVTVQKNDLATLIAIVYKR